MIGTTISKIEFYNAESSLKRLRLLLLRLLRLTRL